MTDLSANILQSNILVQSLLESLFNAELSYTGRGSIPKDLEGKQLEEFQCASTWISYNKLVKDIHQIVGDQVKKVVSPNSKCRICLRDIDTQEVEGRYFTSFIFAIDSLGNILNSPVENNSAKDNQKTSGYFTPEDVVIGMIESTGTHTINATEDTLPEGLTVRETSFSWYGITELQTRASQFIFGLANAYEQSPTIYILDHKTAYHYDPKRNVTVLKYAIAHPEF